MVIVRVFRGVAKGRWKFDRQAVIHDGELKIRVASLKPGTILALEVTVEAIVRPWKYVPLRLTNGNSLSLMADVAMHMSCVEINQCVGSRPFWLRLLLIDGGARCS